MRFRDDAKLDTTQVEDRRGEARRRQTSPLNTPVMGAARADPHGQFLGVVDGRAAALAGLGPFDMATVVDEGPPVVLALDSGPVVEGPWSPTLTSGIAEGGRVVVAFIQGGHDVAVVAPTVSVSGASSTGVDGTAVIDAAPPANFAEAWPYGGSSSTPTGLLPVPLAALLGLPGFAMDGYEVVVSAEAAGRWFLEASVRWTDAGDNKRRRLQVRRGSTVLSDIVNGGDNPSLAYPSEPIFTGVQRVRPFPLELAAGNRLSMWAAHSVFSPAFYLYHDPATTYLRLTQEPL